MVCQQGIVSGECSDRYDVLADDKPIVVHDDNGGELALPHYAGRWNLYRFLGSMGEVFVETREVPGIGAIAELYIEELEGPDATTPLPRALVAWGTI